LALTREGFKVIIFRPRAIYGRYDNTIIPRILRLAEKKRMPVFNRGRALIDITYVDNFVDAVSSSLSAGDNAWNEVYNISNGDPITVNDWFAQLLEIFNRPYRPKNIPEPVAYTMAGIMELISYLPFVNREPPLTRYTVGYLGKTMTMNIEKARRKLGYRPRISNQQGFENYKQWYRGRTARKPAGQTGP
jgi:nucleoside-diphosphate-sugar epimerase